jgi:hypothetical protein
MLFLVDFKCSNDELSIDNLVYWDFKMKGEASEDKVLTTQRRELIFDVCQ